MIITESVESREKELLSSAPFSDACWLTIPQEAKTSQSEDFPCPVFRRAFRLKANIKTATAKVIGLGQYDLYANGKRQGEGFLNGPWSQYNKTLYWQEFYLTKDIFSGVNVLGIELGNSFFRVVRPPNNRYFKGDAMPDYSGENPFLLALVLEIVYTDGSKEKIVTDSKWQWHVGNYTFSHILAGEDYDARILDPSWMSPGYTADNWQKPRVTIPPQAELLKMDWPEFRSVQSWKPEKILSPKPGAWSYLFPQNAMAILRFQVRGKRGATITLKPSEVITPEGEVQQLNLWGKGAYCAYTLKGEETESHEWRFFFHGFQYVELTGAVPDGHPNPEDLPVLESLEMVHIRTDNPQIGEFFSSQELYNRTESLIDWAIRSNMGYSLMDCPHREKLGWLECVHLLFSSIAYRYDSQNWFHKICRDMRDIQLADGRVTTVAPDYLVLPPDNPFKFTIEWGAACVLLPWQAYLRYGDRRFLTENYAVMKAFVDWINTHSVGGIAPQGLGDWYDYGHGQSPGPSRFTPTELTATTMWAMCADTLAKTSDELGKSDEASRYSALHGTIRQAFLARFYDSAHKTLENNGSVQSGYAMALCADLIPLEDRQSVIDAIVTELSERDYQQTPGDVGHLFFIRALAEAGRSDILHKVYSRTGIGSYGGILAKGLTTLPETWDAITVGSNSLNHCMLGHVLEWFYGWVLGIRQAPGSVGWQEVLIAPEPGDLTFAEGKTKIPQGEITVRWTRDEKTFEIEVTIPERTNALVVLPIAFPVFTLNGESTAPFIGPFQRDTVEVGPGHHIVRGFTA